MQARIAFLDSGAGGLPYLSRIREVLPNALFCYVADPAHFPYGEKTPDVLVDLLVNNTELVIRKLNPDIIVLSCNTASVVALDELRRKFPLPFIGVVPAVKQAAAFSITHRFGILATRETVGNPYTQRLIDSFAENAEVFRFAGVDIVRLVEERFFSTTREMKMEVLKEAAEFFLYHEVDTVVLGCTHFIHVREELAELLGNSIALVDSVEGVARQTARVAETLKNRCVVSEGYNALYTISSCGTFYSLTDFAALYNLEFAGALQ